MLPSASANAYTSIWPPLSWYCSIILLLNMYCKCTLNGLQYAVIVEPYEMNINGRITGNHIDIYKHNKLLWTLLFGSGWTWCTKLFKALTSYTCDDATSEALTEVRRPLFHCAHDKWELLPPTVKVAISSTAKTRALPDSVTSQTLWRVS
jgi:hypothetical protein